MIANSRPDASDDLARSAIAASGPAERRWSAPGDVVTAVRARVPKGAGAALLSMVDQGVVSGFSFLTGIAVARVVDIAAFGRFALVMIVVSLAQNVHNALITAPMMTIVGRRRSDPRAYFASLLAWTLILSVAGGGLVALFIAGMFSVRGEDLSWSFLAAAAALTAAQNLQFTLRRLLFARATGVRALGMDMARAAVFAAVALVWRSFTGAISVESLLWILAATALATSLPALRRHLAAGDRGYHLGTVTRRHAPLARWLLPVVIVTFGQEQVVWIIAGTMLGDKAMGGLRASQYLIGLVLLLLSATENVIPVGAARALTVGGARGLRRYLFGAGALIAVPILTLLAGIGLMAPQLLRLVFGPDFVPYAACLRLLAGSVVFILIRDLTANRFRAMQQTGTIFRAFAVSLVVSVLLMYPMLTRFGLIGAALVVLIGHATSMVYLLLAATDAGARLGRFWRQTAEPGLGRRHAHPGRG